MEEISSISQIFNICYSILLLICVDKESYNLCKNDDIIEI